MTLTAQALPGQRVNTFAVVGMTLQKARRATARTVQL